MRTVPSHQNGGHRKAVFGGLLRGSPLEHNLTLPRSRVSVLGAAATLLRHKQSHRRQVARVALGLSSDLRAMLKIFVAVGGEAVLCSGMSKYAFWS